MRCKHQRCHPALLNRLIDGEAGIKDALNRLLVVLIDGLDQERLGTLIALLLLLTLLIFHHCRLSKRIKIIDS